MSYRYKPVAVDAYVFEESAQVYSPDWFQEAIYTERVIINWKLVDGAAKIYGCTLYDEKGRRTADVSCGDIVVREPTGDLRAMTKKKFKALFK